MTGAIAVDVDATAFVDHRRVEGLGAGDVGSEGTDVLFVVPHAELLLAPTVEPPQHRAEPALGMR